MSASISQIMCILAYVFTISGHLHGAYSARTQLQKSAELFDKGLYDDALKILEAVNIKADLDNSDDMKQAFKIRSIAHGQKGQELEAREAIRELFFLDPTYKFDPFDTPKQVLSWATLEQDLIAQKNERLAGLKTPPSVRTEAPVDFEAKIDSKVNLKEKPPLVSSLFPLGLNHFYLGSPLKGSIYLTLQSLGLIGNIGAYWWKHSYLQKFGSSRIENKHYKTNFDTAQLVQYLSLGSAVAAYIVSIIDALININDNDQPYSFPRAELSDPELNDIMIKMPRLARIEEE